MSCFDKGQVNEALHGDWPACTVRETDPLCATSTCLRPIFLNISTTVSIGVWSEIWNGDCDVGGEPGEKESDVSKLIVLSLNPTIAFHWNVKICEPRVVLTCRLQPI